METKAQLTDAARAYEKRMLGLSPIGTLSVTSDGAVESLFLQLWHDGKLWPREVFKWPQGRLKASQAEVMTLAIEAAVYDWLMIHVGFQEELETIEPPG